MTENWNFISDIFNFNDFLFNFKNNFWSLRICFLKNLKLMLNLWLILKLNPYFNYFLIEEHLERRANLSLKKLYILRVRFSLFET